jgi:hypothetical protein
MLTKEWQYAWLKPPLAPRPFRGGRHETLPTAKDKRSGWRR